MKNDNEADHEERIANCSENNIGQVLILYLY